MDVSIIIVSYNTKELLEKCLRSIYGHTSGVSYEIIVSDNGSEDGTLEMLERDFTGVKVIKNGENLGFGTANNRARKTATGKYVFFLNSDTVLENNAVKFFHDYWEEHSEENIGALGTILIDKEGNQIHSGGEFPEIDDAIKSLFPRVIAANIRTFMNKVFKIEIPKQPNSTAETDAEFGKTGFITGADLFMKNNDDAEFDENIFLYCEDLELQFRLKEKGLERILIEGPRIIHFEGASCSEETDKVRYFQKPSTLNFNLNRVYYFKKSGASPMKVAVLKTLTLMLWTNPLLIEKSEPFIKKLMKI